jgi:transposase-like protein
MKTEERMTNTLDSTLLDTLTPIQAEVLKSLVAGSTISAAARDAGVHRSTVHLWTRNRPTFARALLTARQDHAETLLDELSDLSDLALDTFRQLLTDPETPASTRLRAAMEIVKLVQNQRPTELAKLRSELQTDKNFQEMHLATVAQPPISAVPISAAPKPAPPKNGAEIQKQPVRNAPCPCGSRLKYKRCCGNLAVPPQTRAA